MVDKNDDENFDNRQYFELKYLHEKEPVTDEFVKAYYLHLVLDHLKETRFNDLERAINEFLTEKVLIEIRIHGGMVISFKKALDEVISFLRRNEREILGDIHAKGDFE
nr:hypothetical protein [Candidatus Sigynarchaeota archaeon]